MEIHEEAFFNPTNIAPNPPPPPLPTRPLPTTLPSHKHQGRTKKPIMGKAELKTKLTAEITDLGSQIAAAKKEGKPKDEVSAFVLKCSRQLGTSFVGDMNI